MKEDCGHNTCIGCIFAEICYPDEENQLKSKYNE